VLRSVNGLTTRRNSVDMVCCRGRACSPRTEAMSMLPSRKSEKVISNIVHTAPPKYSSSYPMPGKWLYRLKSCSSLTRPLQTQCRHSSTYVPGRILKGDELGPTRADAHQTFRVRKDETAKDLPLSPLLDPVILEKRSRFEQTKERPRVAEFTPFQKKLWENPFGMQCAATHKIRD
jgi:hypothetical protein